MGMKEDLRDFAYNILVGARQNAQNISETDDLLGFSHRTISELTENGLKKRKYPISSNCVDENTWM